MTGNKLVFSLVLMGLGSSCGAVKTIAEAPEDKMVRLKVERIEILDVLYAEYGGSDIVNATTTAAQEIADATTVAAKQAVGDMAKETVGAETENSLAEVVAEAAARHRRHCRPSSRCPLAARCPPDPAGGVGRGAAAPSRAAARGRGGAPPRQGSTAPSARRRSRG